MFRLVACFALAVCVSGSSSTHGWCIDTYKLSLAGTGQSELKCGVEKMEVKQITVISANATCQTETLEYVQLQCKKKESCTLDAAGLCDSIVHVRCELKEASPLVLMAIIFLLIVNVAMGCTMTFDELAYAAKHWKAVMIGWGSQFVFMPMLCFILCHIFGFDNATSVGVMLMGMSPGGSTSNLFTYFAKGNVPLSVVMSAASTLCCAFMIPLNMLIYIKTSFADDDFDIPFANVFMTLGAILIGVFTGMFIRAQNKKLKIKGKFVHEWTAQIFAGLGAVLMTLICFTGLTENIDIFSRGSETLCAFIIQPVGCAFGYTIASMLGLADADKRAICLETGIQNMIVAIAIVESSMTGCAKKKGLLAPLLSAVAYFVHSVWITLLLRYRARSSSDEPEEGKNNQLKSQVAPCAGPTTDGAHPSRDDEDPSLGPKAEEPRRASLVIEDLEKEVEKLVA